MLGLTMGVATLITVMTIVQGATFTSNRKIANSAPTVSRSRASLRVADFQHHLKALKIPEVELDDMQASPTPHQCEEVGATASASTCAPATLTRKLPM